MTWDWSPVSRNIGDHSSHKDNEYLYIYKQISANFLKNKITSKIFTYKSYTYIYLILYLLMTHVELNC